MFPNPGESVLIRQKGNSNKRKSSVTVLGVKDSPGLSRPALRARLINAVERGQGFCGQGAGDWGLCSNQRGLFLGVGIGSQSWTPPEGWQVTVVKSMGSGVKPQLCHLLAVGP